MQKQQWLFTPFRLDPANAALWREMQAVALPPKVFAVLCHLVEHAGRLVTKDELLDAVWQGRFVSESTLKDCINDLRKALGDDPRAPRYIETMVRRGYRFIAEVSGVPSSEAGEHLTAAPVPRRWARPEAVHWAGREGPLSRLQGILQKAVRGEPQVVFVTGEAGIGKTTLMEMFLERLAGLGLRVLWGQCIEHYGAGEPFLPLLQALGQCCRVAGGEGLKARLRHHAPTWLAQMPWTLESGEREALQREVLGATKERMLRELCEVVEALSLEAPLILVLEDLHWSDYATLDLISLLARRRERAALLMVGTYRPVELILGGHPLKGVKQELQSHELCSELPLDALSPSEVARYLALRFPGSGVAEVLAPLIYRRTEGHPLFMVKLVEYLIAQGRLVHTQGRWVLGQGEEGLDSGIPESLRQMIEHQIERLSLEEQRLLGVASVAGAECSAALLAAVLGSDIVEIESCCEALARRGQVLTLAGIAEWPDGTVAGRYAFLHALYLEILYQRLAPAQRVHLHRRLGECLETAYGDRAGEIAAELAVHFEQGRDWWRAVNYLRGAAEQAVRRCANREAIAHLSRALDLIERLPGVERAGTRIDLLEQRGAVRRSMGDMQGAISDLTAMLTCARAAGQPFGEIRALVDLNRACVWVDRRRCLELAAEAVECSRDLPDEDIKALIRSNCAHWNLYLRGWREEDARASRQALEVARRKQNPRILNTRLTFRAFLECMSSNYRAACAAAEEGMEVAQGLGDGYQFMVCHYWRIWALLHLGEWGEARRNLREALLTAERNANLFAMTACQLELAWLHAEALDHEGARAYCERVFELIPPGHDIFTSCLGNILLAKASLGLRDSRRAFACLDEIRRRVEGEGMLMDAIFYPPFYQGLCEYWLVQGDRGQARQEARRLCEVASAPPERTYLALGHQLLAEAAIAEQRWEEAHEELAQALEVIEGAEIPLAAWRVYATAARLHASQGRTSEAEGYWRQGREVVYALAGSLEEGDPVRQSLLAHPLLKTTRN